jgi:hypothetical protein
MQSEAPLPVACSLSGFAIISDGFWSTDDASFHPPNLTVQLGSGPTFALVADPIDPSPDVRQTRFDLIVSQEAVWHETTSHS